MSAHAPSLPASLLRALRVAVCVYLVFIVWQSLIPAGTGGTIPHLDKVVHGIVYALLAAGMTVAWPRLSKKSILIGCITVGVVLEIAQGVMSLGRTASVWDGLANGIGVVLGIGLAILLTQKFIRQ